MKSERLTLLAGAYGNAVEWYDFTAYAAFAPILAKVFFPNDDPVLSLLLTFGVFAIGFLGRPLGALIIGYYGDKLGRRAGLLISITLITLPTFCLGLLPTHAQWGIASAIVLTLLRFIQGMAVSGELTTATSYLVEHALHNRRGLAGSLAMASAFFGIVISALVAVIITACLTPLQVQVFGWRAAFLLGAILGLIGLWLRLRCPETHLFNSVKDKQTNITFLSHCKHLRAKPLVLSILLTSSMALGNYCVIAFFATYLHQYINMPLKTVMWLSTANLTVMTGLIPFFGALSDKLGRKPLLLGGLLGSIISVFPVFYLLNLGTTWTALLGLLIFTFSLTPITALIPTTLAELFHVQSRNLSLSLGYNISLAAFGGTAPLICIWLIQSSNHLYAPVAYILFCLLLSLAAWIYVEESFEKPLM